MIKIENLTKSFRKNPALKNINLLIDEKVIIGLIGNNGAGKTTLINQIMGYASPTSGNISVLGENPNNNLHTSKHLTLIDEKVSHDPLSTLKQIIKTHKELDEDFSEEKCIKIMEMFELPTKKFYRNLSKGMKNQFNIAIGLASNKKITVMDEPVSGLDEGARDKFYKYLIEDYFENPRLMIVSSHLVAELQDIVSKVIVMRKGEIICYGDNEVVSQKFVKVRGSTESIKKLMAYRKGYAYNSICNLSEAIFDNDLSVEEKKFIREERLEIENVKINECCRIMCDSKWEGSYGNI